MRARTAGVTHHNSKHESCSWIRQPRFVFFGFEVLGNDPIQLPVEREGEYLEVTVAARDTNMVYDFKWIHNSPYRPYARLDLSVDMMKE